LNVAYLIPVVARGFFRAPADEHHGGGIHEAPAFCLVPICITAAGCLAMFFTADPVYRLLLPIAAGRGAP